jgi:hypothetical protein
MAESFPKKLDDNCPWCRNQRRREVQLQAVPKGPRLHIVCPECNFDMTDGDYSAAKLAGRL